MKDTQGNDPSTSVSRRAFLGRGALGAAGAAAVGMGARVEAAGKAETPAEENPWRYDIDSLRRVDPALIHYDRVVLFPVGGATVRRFALGPDGRVYVASGKSVLVFTPEGARAAEIAVGDLVRAIHVSRDGRVYVGLRDRVEIYDGSGRRAARWPAHSGKPFITGVAATATDVFVADSGNRVVYRFDLDGGSPLRLGEKNAERRVPGLVLPSPFLDVEPGADGLLRVNNPGRHKVELYTRGGDLEQSWGKSGVSIEAFCGCCNPVALALLPDGRCVTAEKGLPRVKVYDAEGRLESVVAGPDSFAAVASEDREAATTTDTVHDGLDVAVDAQGKVWVLDLVGATVQAFQRKPAGGGGGKGA